MVDYQFTLTQIDIAKEAFQFTQMILMTNITTIMVNFYYSTKNSNSLCVAVFCSNKNIKKIGKTVKRKH